MADKQVKVKVATDVELSKVESLEKHIQQLKQEKIDLKVQANQTAISTLNEEINRCKTEIKQLSATEIDVRANAQQINEIIAKVDSLEQEKINLEIAVADEQLNEAKAEVNELDGKEISINLAMTNLAMGVQTAKQGVSELANNMRDVQQAAIQTEQNEAFLTMNLGAEKAKQTMQEISDIVASMPGDDNTMRNVLSTAQALGNNLNADQMRAATGTMADYMSASAKMGKQSLESQQDIMKYLLDGNTAELERGSIVSAYVDKLKNADTFMERQAAMQEVLNDLGYGGMAQLDTMANQQETWNGMIYNSKVALGDMWLGAEKGAMKYIGALNDATGGLLGMGIVAGQMVGGPFIDVMTGIGQIATGVKALKELELGDTLRKWASGFAELAKATLTAGYSALKSAGMWMIEKAQIVATTIASYALAFAEFLVANPIILLIIIIGALIGALIYLYNTNEDVRNAINGLGQTFLDIGNMIMSALQGVWDYITSMGGLIPEQVSLTGNSIVDSILGVIGFLLTLPLQLGMIFTNMLAKTMGFGDNFVQRMFQTAVQSVTSFINQIKNMYNKLVNELNNMLNAVKQWASQLWQRFKQAALDALNAFLGALGIHSPGIMQVSLIREITDTGKRIPNESRNLLYNIGVLGSDIVDEFGNPSLGLNYNTNGNFLNNAVASSNNNGNNALGGVTINMEIGSVDNEERVNEIVDAIIHRLTFENATAGRTV